MALWVKSKNLVLEADQRKEVQPQYWHLLWYICCFKYPPLLPQSLPQRATLNLYSSIELISFLAELVMILQYCHWFALSFTIATHVRPVQLTDIGWVQAEAFLHLNIIGLSPVTGELQVDFLSFNIGRLSHTCVWELWDSCRSDSHPPTQTHMYILILWSLWGLS